MLGNIEMNDHFHHIPKTNIDRVIELFNALRIIDDSLDFLRNGRSHFIGVIYSQLRSLLTDKTTEPLLFTVSEILNEELSLYYLDYDINKNIPGAEESMILRVTGMPLSTKLVLPKQTKITLREYLKTHPLTYKKQKFRVETIINHLSNELGGAHYSDSVKKYLTELNSIGFNNQPMLNNYVIQLVELAKELGLNTIKKITDFEILLNLFIPETNSKKQEFLLDFAIPNSNNRISIFINQSKFHVQMIDCLGRTFIHRINEIIPLSKFYLIDFSHRLTNDFKSEIKLFFNEIELLSIVLDEPLLMLNELVSYERYFNRSQEKTNENFQFGLSDVLMFGEKLNHLERLRAYSHLTNTEPTQVMYFENESFGYIKAGEKDMKMEGKVKIVKVEDLNN